MIVRCGAASVGKNIVRLGCESRLEDIKKAPLESPSCSSLSPLGGISHAFILNSFMEVRGY